MYDDNSWFRITGQPNGRTRIYGDLRVEDDIISVDEICLDNGCRRTWPSGTVSTADSSFRWPTGTYGSIEVYPSGKNSWEGYSINGRYVLMSADSNQVGLYNDVDNEWMLYCARNNYCTMYYNGASRIRAQSNGMYLWGGIETGGNGVSGNYGTLQVNGGGKGNWEGFSINGRAVFMHSGGSETGIYNDVNNEWILYANHNSYTYLYYNGGWQLRTQSNGIRSNNNVYADSNMYASAFYYSSDRRLKTNIKPIEDSTDKIMKLEGVSFNWKEDGRRDIGLVAQDVAKVFPEAVALNDETGYNVLEYGHLVAPLVEATKEQQEELNEHDREIRQLQMELNKLKKEITPLIETTKEQQQKINQQEREIMQLRLEIQKVKVAEI